MAQVKAQSAQEFLPIEEIRDGIVLLKDGTMKIVLMASSLNFALKSAEEQEAIIFQYQNFLNSLDFSVQFFIQSRRLNITPYLDTLREAASAQPNELLKIQTNEYVEFMKSRPKFTRISDEKFEEYKTQLWQRVDTVSQGLIRSGVRLAPLNTEELVELYYGLFNPGELEKGKAPEVSAR